MIISADFSMWKEKSNSECVSEIEQSLGPKADKRAVLSDVKREWNSLKSAKIKYESTGDQIKSRPKPRKVTLSDSENEVFGMCPVASEKTVCCNLMTIDACLLYTSPSPRD